MDGGDTVAETEVAPAAVAGGLALGAGVLGGIQPKINAVLGDRLGSTVVASLVNFSAALAVVLVVLSVRPTTRRTLRGLRSWPVPRWTFLAGLGGVAVVLAGVVSVETIGVAAFSVAFFAGQLGFGLVVDRFGIGPGGARPIAGVRAASAAIAAAAVVVSQVGQPVESLSPGLVAIVVVAGAASALQSACNGRIVVGVGDPFAATSVNVVVGTSALTATVAALAMAGRIDTLHWPTEPWLYVGGVLGVTIVLTLAIATASLGVLRTTIVMLAAQLVTAFVVDWLVHDEVPSAGVLVGAAMVVVAVVLVRRPERGSVLPRTTPIGA